MAEPGRGSVYTDLRDAKSCLESVMHARTLREALRDAAAAGRWLEAAQEKLAQLDLDAVGAEWQDGDARTGWPVAGERFVRGWLPHGDAHPEAREARWLYAQRTGRAAEVVEVVARSPEAADVAYRVVGVGGSTAAMHGTDVDEFLEEWRRL